MSIIAADKHYLVVGLGMTGKSCARYLANQGKSVSVIDSRVSPPGLAEFQAEFPNLNIHCGSFERDIIDAASVLVMSPGVSLATPEIANAISNGAVVTSDIELFLNQFNGQVVGITGSNAKSTVTEWLGEALKNSGKNVLVAGNIGHAVLDFAGQDFDIAVLELSSFQLELINKLSADVATILNISEDHLDRYSGMSHYQQAKQRIYFGVKKALFNRDDLLTQPLVPDSVLVKSFGSNYPDLRQYGLITEDNETFLGYGFEKILPAKEVSLPGQHNVLNALAVLALADAFENDREATVKALKEFKGLPHRCQLVREVAGVRYFNDSKATNVGSTQAALHGLGNEQSKNLILMLGGQGKGQDFSPLNSIVEKLCRLVVVYGQDKSEISKAIPSAVVVETMRDAFDLATRKARSNDIVLLSPSCASFDEFKNFEHRGDVFCKWVEGIA